MHWISLPFSKTPGWSLASTSYPIHITLDSPVIQICIYLMNCNTYFLSKKISSEPIYVWDNEFQRWIGPIPIHPPAMRSSSYSHYWDVLIPYSGTMHLGSRPQMEKTPICGRSCSASPNCCLSVIISYSPWFHRVDVHVTSKYDPFISGINLVNRYCLKAK